jgi:hypothetical protein
MPPLTFFLDMTVTEIVTVNVTETGIEIEEKD